VQNTNSYPVSFTLQVDTHTLTNFTAIPLTNAIPYTNSITDAPQYYSFIVPANAVLASFEILHPSSELNLYARHALPLPTSDTFDYQSAYLGPNYDLTILVTTNSTNLLGRPITTNSVPVPLTPGTWYLAVENPNPSSTLPYHIVATYITNGAINIIPLTNYFNGLWQTNGVAQPGPALTNFYSYTVTNPAASAVQFTLGGLSANLDLLARVGSLPTPQQLTDGSFNPGTTSELIIIATNAQLPSLLGTTWYLAVPNNSSSTAPFTTITATTLTNAHVVTTPAIVMGNLTVDAEGFTFTWTAIPGAQYQIQTSSDLIHWTNAATITPDTYIGVYTDPTPASQLPTRFFQVVQSK
jgi:hypothetical protein